MVSEPELLLFPTEYPIKVLGRPTDEFRARVHAVMLHHAPRLDPDRIGERLSENGKYLAITYGLVADSAEQVTALVTDLKAIDGVLMVI